MANTLIVGSEFDPSGFTAGLTRSVDQYDLFSNRIASQPIVIPPPVFDISGFTQEVIAASDTVRRELDAAFDARELGAAARDAGNTAANELQTGLLAKLGNLQDEVAQNLISPAAFQRQADLALAAYSQSMQRIAKNPIILPPPVFDSVQFTTEVIKAADIMRNALVNSLNRRGLSTEAAQSAAATADAFVVTFLNKLATLRDELAQNLISPQSFVQQGELALQEASQAIQQQVRTLPPLEFRAKVITPATDNVITDADLAAAEQLAGGNVSAAEGIAGLEQRVKSLTADFQSGLKSQTDYKNGLFAIRQEAIALRESGLINTEIALGTFNRVLRSTKENTEEAVVGIRQMRLGAAQMAVQAVGTSGAVGQMAQGLLIFSGGSSLAIGVALGLTVIGLAYERLTSSARELREEQNKLAQGLAGQVAAGPPDTLTSVQQLRSGDIHSLTQIEELERGIVNARQRQADLLKEINSGLPAELGNMEGILAAAGRVLGISTLLLDPVKRISEGLRLEREIRLGNLKLRDDELRVENQLIGARRAQTEQVVSFASSLGSALQAHVRIADSARLVTVYENQLKDLLSSNVQDYRLVAQTVAAINVLERSRVAGLEQLSARQQQVAQQQAQRFQELQGQQGSLFAPITIDVDVSQALDSLNQLQAPLDRSATALHAFAKSLLLSPITADLGRQLEQEANAIDAFNRKIDADNIKFEETRVARAEASAAAVLEAFQQEVDRQPTVLLPVSLDVEQAVGDLQALRDELSNRAAQFQSAGLAVPPQVAQKLNVLERQLQDALALPAKLLLQSTGALSDRLVNLAAVAENVRALETQGVDRPDTIGQIAERERALVPILAQLQTRYDAITAAIADEHTPQTIVNDLLREQVSLLDQMVTHRQPTPLEVTQLQPIQDAVQQYADAKQKFEAATAQRLKPEARAAADEMDAAGRVLDLAADSTVRAILALHLTAEETQRILDRIAEAYGRIGRQAHQASEETLRIVRALTLAGQAADALQSVRDTFSGVGRDAGDAIGNIADLGKSISNVGEDILRGDVFGAIADALKGVKSIGNLLGFGKSEHEKLLERAQQENTAALHIATRAYQTFTGRFQGVGGLAEQREIVERVTGSAAGQAAIEAGDIDALREAALGAGTTLDEMREIARQYNVSLVRDHALVAGSTDALTNAMDLAIRQTTEFGNSFAEQTQRLDIQSRLFGEPGGLSPEQQFQNQVTAASALSEGVAQAFAGVDLQSQPEVRQALQELFTKFDEGFFTAHPELFGGLTKSDFFELLDGGADFLDDFNKGLGDATKSLGNVPDSFKLAAAEFAARPISAPGSFPVGIGLPLPPPSIDPGSLGVGQPPVVGFEDDLKQLVDVLAKRGAGGNRIEKVELNFLGAVTDPVKFAKQLKRLLEEINMDQEGNPNGTEFSAPFTE